MTKPNKFHARRTASADGITHASAKEARRWAELQLLERGGEIRALRRQIIIPLIGQNAPLRTATGKPMKMTVDFAYEDKRLGWAQVFEDSKGVETRDFAVRLAVVEAMGIKVKLS